MVGCSHRDTVSGCLLLLGSRRCKVLVTSGQLRPALAKQMLAYPSTKTAPLAARQCSTQAGSYFGGGIFYSSRVQTLCQKWPHSLRARGAALIRMCPRMKGGICCRSGRIHQADRHDMAAMSPCPTTSWASCPNSKTPDTKLAIKERMAAMPRCPPRCQGHCPGSQANREQHLAGTATTSAPVLQAP